MSDWLITKGVDPGGYATAEDVVARALQECLAASFQPALAQPRIGKTSQRFRFGDCEWLDISQFLVVHRPSGMFWSVDWSDMPSSAAMLSQHPCWQGTWLAYGWHAERFKDWNISAERCERIWPGFNVGFYPNQLRYVVHAPTFPSLLHRDGRIKPSQELLHYMPEDVLYYSERIRAWPDAARPYGARLCLPGVAAWAKRDADCWASGIPTIVLPHGGRLAGDPDCWIPAAVDVDRYGKPTNAIAAAATISAVWKELREDRIRLRQLAIHARQYYESYGDPVAVSARIAAIVRTAV